MKLNFYLNNYDLNKNMIKSVIVNKEEFLVNDNEFNTYKNEMFSNLILVESLDYQERLISLIRELSLVFNEKVDLIFYNTTHGGYVPIKCCDVFDKVHLYNTNTNQRKNILSNILKFEKINISITDTLKYILNPCICVIDNKFTFVKDLNLNNNLLPLLIIREEFINNLNKNLDYERYRLTDTNLIVCIPGIYKNKFYEEFHYFINRNELNYDNLINYTMIVKNAGSAFEDVLKQNMNFIDRWTILDTGSTDQTIDVINKVLVGKKKGKLYQEPFINFRDSRNRCLELAGKECKYNIMLDDTYVIKGDIRSFLKLIRSDQFADSYSTYIKSNDSEYGSNRITKTESELRYKYKLHEVITPVENVNVMIPINIAYIIDYRFDYMEERTMNRKKYDLDILHEMEKEEPEDSRSLYYLGQTYNLVKNFEKAYEYFIKRVEHDDDGFLQEKIDACFEAARVAQFQLNKPWEEVKKLYERSYNMDKSRHDSLYFLGIYEYMNGDKKNAYEYFKKAFELGYPEHCQYSLKPTLAFYFLPKFLTELCYYMNDYETGFEASKLFLEHNTPDANGKVNYQEIFNLTDYELILSYNSIFTCLKQMPSPKTDIFYPQKPYLCFVVDGGFENWTGKDILSKGMGGSETCMVELARYIQKSGYFQVVVFCKCDYNDNFEGVEYRNLSEYYSFVTDNYVHSCMISRYSHYTSVAVRGNVENIYMIAHDLSFSGIIIPQDKLRKIFCLSEWHVKYLGNIFSTLKDITEPFYYGINFDIFFKHKELQKIPYKFIYSSFPNRGLLPLLQMWPQILERYPQATLYIYSNVDGKWVNSVKGEEMQKIRKIIMEYKKNKKLDSSIYYKGWVSKPELAKSWMTADIWFYPCTFLETFCHTALEAALSKTLAIGRNFGSLENTIGDRGLLLEGDFYDEKVQKHNLIKVFKLLEDKERKERLIEENYKWALNLSWENRANDLLQRYLIPTLPKDQQEINKKDDNSILNTSINELNLNNILDNKIEVVLNYLKLISNKDIKTFKLLSLETEDGLSTVQLYKSFKSDMTIYAIDKWDNSDIEKRFYDNIMNINPDKVQVYKDDINNSLIKFVRKNKKFNIIYVNKFNDIQSYVNLTTAFSILENNGIIIINNIKDRNILNNFMNTFNKVIKIINYDNNNLSIIQKADYN